MSRIPRFARQAVWVSTAVSVVMLACGSSSEARVTRIVIDATAPLTGQNIPYTQVRGRAFGVLDHDYVSHGMEPRDRARR